MALEQPLPIGQLLKLHPEVNKPLPRAESEEGRLGRLKSENLDARSKNSKTRKGAGAYDGTSIPAVVARPGKPVVRILAEQGKMPVKNNTALKGFPL